LKKINIAIDGYSSCGKSTLAKQLAAHLGYIYIDSGAMYRAITLHALQSGFYEEEQLQKQALINSLPQVDVSFANTPQLKNVIMLNGKAVETEIRQLNVSNKVSEIAAIPEVRLKLVELQRKMAQGGGIVMDGRDIGTHVMPNAELKLFMTASPEIRAQRRFNEMQQKGIAGSYEDVLQNLAERDRIDSTRETNPLRQAADAIVIDNSHLTMEVQFDKTLALVNEVLEKVQN
jgi:cytidylate kinase